MQPSLDAFHDVHKPYAAACDVADAAHVTRDAALEAIGIGATTLKVRVETLTAKLVDAKLGTRIRPLVAYSTYSPSGLGKLRYETQQSETLKLAEAVLAQVTDPAVKKAAQEVKTAAEAQGLKIQGLVNPQAVLAGAMATRDALLLDWHDKWREFKTQLRAAWSKEPGKVAFVLAPPPALVAGKKRTGKKTVPVPAETPGEPTA